MPSILLSVLLISAVYSQKTSFKDPRAFNPKYHVGISEKYISEIGCLKKLDSILKTEWARELNKIPTTDLGNLGKVQWNEKDSFYTRYNTYEDEWLMHIRPPAKVIEQCVRDLVPDVVPLMMQSHIECLNEMFATHIMSEIDYHDEYTRFLKITSREQLPFRKVISFTEFAEILFQNRNPDALTDLERVLYEHAESYLTVDEDRDRPSFTRSLDCDWIDAKALREVSSDTARFKEFVSQVHRSVDKQLGGQLLKKWSLNETLSKDRYDRWLEARKAMMSRIEEEVEILQKQRKDAQWLCEYATKLANKFSKEQSSILLAEDRSWVHLEVSDVAAKARTVEKALGKLNDFRHGAIKTIADKYEEGSRCMFAFLRLVQNHRKYDLATAFIDQHYLYQELFCNGKTKNFGIVQVYFCNCAGSFCTSHPLAALFADEYVFTQGPDGSYQVVRSGRTSKRKIMHCHILANGNKIS